MSNLTPIDIERALEISMGAASTPTLGPVEAVLHAALKRMGPDGEWWCKGTVSKDIAPRVVRKIKSTRPQALQVLCDNLRPEDIAFQIEDVRLPAGTAYCSIGAIDVTAHAVHKGGSGHYEVQATALEVFEKANGIVHGIPEWNDQPRRCWFEVKRAFERAIALAHAKGL